MILLLIALLRRYRRADALVLCGAVLALAVATGIPGVRTLTAERQAAAGPEEGSTPVVTGVFDQLEADLALVQQYLLDGNLEEAGSVLDTLRATDASEPRVALATARLAALEQKWTDAALLYRKAQALIEYERDFPEAEYAAVTALADSSSIGAASMAVWLSEQGLDPALYGLNAETGSSAADPDDLWDLIEEELETELENALTTEDDLEDTGPVIAARHASRITAEFRSYLESGSFDKEQLRRSVTRLVGILEEDPALNQNAALRVARLKGYVLLEDYGRIAECVDTSACLEELMIVSELYLGGYVKEKDFSEVYAGLVSEELEPVLEQCRSILDGGLSDYSKDRREECAEKVDSLESLRDADAVSNLRRDLRSQVSGSVGNLTSKGWLTMAKLEQKLGNDAMADDCITQAFGTVGLSDDTQYTVPMNALLGIIGGNSEGGTEDLKLVATYVEQAVDHSLPLDLTSTQLTAAPTLDAPTEDTDSAADSFTEHMTNTVSQQTATLNIGVINKDDFPIVKARIQVNSSQVEDAEDLASVLQVYDVGSQITDFEVEALEFQTSRIILLCDVSGSMDGSVQSLRDAITGFAAEMNEGEQVSVIGFDDGIRFEHGFSDDPAEVAEHAADMGAYGGTDIYGSLKYVMGLFPDDINANNIVILMTDGVDNSPAGEATLRNEIGALAAANSVTVYTLGLGSSVDTNYLTLLAEAGNGSFLYVDSQESLNAFYDFVHQQLTSQYILTYTAKNLTVNQRKLELSVTGELGGAEKIYYLVEPEYSDQSSAGYNAYVVTDTDIKVYGLNTKFLYRSSRDQVVFLKGEGFDTGDDITVKLSDNVSYVLNATFVDTGTYELTIPANVAMGTYDLEVSVRGEIVTLKDELTLAAQGSEKSFRYGSYEFTALQSYVDDSGCTVLSGNVTMNGWLRFLGDVVIEGQYLDSGYVQLRDDSGCYISYAEKNSSGLANFMAQKCIPVAFGPLGQFELYVNDYTPGKYADFPVDKIDLWEGPNLLFLVSTDMRLELYPDMIKLVGPNMELSLPFQKQLLRNFPKVFGKFEDSRGMTADVMFNATQIAFKGSYTYETFRQTDFDDVDFVGLPVQLTKVTLTADTLLNDYTLEGGVRFPALKDMVDSMEISLGIKNGRFDSIGLQSGGDYDVTLITTPVPVSVSDFGFTLGGFSQYESDNTALENVLNSTVAISFKTSVGKAPDLVQKLSDFLGVDEIAFATLEDCKLELALKKFCISFEADAKLFSILDVGRVEISAGIFDYQNDLVQLGSDTVAGLRAKVQIGDKWESKNCYLQLEGAAELVFGWPYFGLTLTGDLGYDVGWWIFRADEDLHGDALIAVYQNQLNEAQFSIVLRGRDSNGRYGDGFSLHVAWDTDLSTHTY